MPLTGTGEKVLGEMKDQYGSKKGKSVFYASINKGKPGSRKWEAHRQQKLGDAVAAMPDRR